MQKITISYQMPEDREDFTAALKGSAAFAALETISNEVFRPARKHGYNDAKIQIVLDTIDQLIDQLELPDNFPKDEWGNKVDATHLVSLLEKRFSNILQDYQIDLWG
jgi:hypothetical protein